MKIGSRRNSRSAACKGSYFFEQWYEPACRGYGLPQTVHYREKVTIGYSQNYIVKRFYQP